MADEYIEKLFTCPFNETHVIRASRWQYHLEKCRKNYQGGVKMAVCPFDRRHEMPEVELRSHMNCCPSRGPLESLIAKEFAIRAGISTGGGNCDLPPPMNPDVPASETWDMDDDGDLSYLDIEAYSRREAVLLRQEQQPTAESSVRHPQQQSKAQSYTQVPPPSRPPSQPIPTLQAAGIGRGRPAILNGPGLGASQKVGKPQVPFVAGGGAGPIKVAQNPLIKGPDDPCTQPRGRGRLVKPAEPVSSSQNGSLGLNESVAATAPWAKSTAAVGWSNPADRVVHINKAAFPTLQDAVAGNVANGTGCPVKPRYYSDILAGRGACDNATTFTTQYQRDSEEYSVISRVETSHGQVRCEGDVRHNTVEPCGTTGQIKTSESSGWSVLYSADRGSSSLSPSLGRGRSLPGVADKKPPLGAQESSAADKDRERRQAIISLAKLSVGREHGAATQENSAAEKTEEKYRGSITNLTKFTRGGEPDVAEESAAMGKAEEGHPPIVSFAKSARGMEPVAAQGNSAAADKTQQRHPPINLAKSARSGDSDAAPCNSAGKSHPSPATYAPSRIVSPASAGTNSLPFSNGPPAGKFPVSPQKKSSVDPSPLAPGAANAVGALGIRQTLLPTTKDSSRPLLAQGRGQVADSLSDIGHNLVQNGGAAVPGWGHGRGSVGDPASLGWRHLAATLGGLGRGMCVPLGLNLGVPGSMAVVGSQARASSSSGGDAHGVFTSSG